MLKRILATWVLGTLTLALVACGSSKAPGVQLAPSAGPIHAAPVAIPPSPPVKAAKPPPAPKVPPALAKKPVVKVPSGPPPKQLVVKDLIKGSGAVAKAGSSLIVNYVGVLYKRGAQFDSSYAHGQPFGPFPLGKGMVIPGWDKGLVGMKVGSRRELVIPSSLAYGKAGQAPKIPPNAALIFVIDLLAIS